MDAGKVQGEFAADDLLQSAVAYQLQIIGEAAGHLSDQFRQRHGDIPWRKVIAMRNVLAHGYMHVDIDRVWDTVVGDLAPLLDVVRPYAPPIEHE